MKRTLIIGSPGSGKSTLAKRLRDLLDLPVFHLDTFYHQPNWTLPDEEEWKRTVTDLIKQDEWIIDGNYGGTMEMRLERCDSAIWLDYPRAICTWRVLKRMALYRNRTRSDMAEGCNERFDWEFTKYVWNFPRDKRSKLEERLRRYSHADVFHIRSNRELENFLMKLNTR